MKSVEADEAAENFTRFLGEVLAQRQSLAISQEGVPCAYLIPAGEHKCDSHELADDLASVELTEDDRHTLAAAVRRGRKAFKPLKNPWG